MQALKGMALGLLNTWVSPYVDNLNAKDLSLSVFGGKCLLCLRATAYKRGNLQFHSLHLKKSLLERFGLPVEIVAGDIGTLSITIPWHSLKSSPVQVNIDDVYVLARARPQGKIDPEEDERIDQATKQERLKRAEAVDNATSQVGAGDDGGQFSLDLWYRKADDTVKQTYLGAMITKVVDNVQINIKNIHVRYEDGTNTPDVSSAKENPAEIKHPFAAGITVDEFKAVSTDGNWLEAFIQDSKKGVHKLVKLAALAVYFDTDTGSLAKSERVDTIDALKHMLSGPGKHQYILKPVTGEARVSVEVVS
jgi:vacuolar protein sorting-associated protein 13A/C